LVAGAQIPGGKITVSDPATGKTYTAADPGDYLYPSDVRFDAAHDLLYVKADGLARGIAEQTWLFTYDVRRHEITRRVKVRNGQLSEECPVPEAAPQ
jgi:hypothetical protein